MSEPWENEPDEKVWEAHGLPCVLLRNNHNGAWCGYAGVPPTHKAYDNPSYRRELDVHGGVWVSFAIKDNPPFPNGYYWFGFDCAHGGDYCPKVKEHHGDPYRRYCDITYATREAESMAAQLARLEVDDGEQAGATGATEADETQ